MQGARYHSVSSSLSSSKKKSYAGLTLFCKCSDDAVSDKATILADLILHGGEPEIEKALDLVQEDPNLLRGETVGRDRLGRWVQGKPLAIAAMAGDVSVELFLKDEVVEKQQGLVERLVIAGNLSPQEIIEQLKVITSNEARLANEQRNQLMLSAMINFGEGLIKLKADQKFNKACAPLIKQLEEDLIPDPNLVYKSGFVFDSKILWLVANWFKTNATRFGDANVSVLVNGDDPIFWTKSSAFWVKGFGKLQELLSSRDAHFVVAGIANSRYVIPPRTLKNSGGLSYFIPANLSGLGDEFYLSARSGKPATGLDWTKVECSENESFFKRLEGIKNHHIDRIVQLKQDEVKDNQRCLVM